MGQYRQQTDKDGQQECVFLSRFFVIVGAETFRAAQWDSSFMSPVTALTPTASVERQGLDWQLGPRAVVYIDSK
jgi:hypothetical protein